MGTTIADITAGTMDAADIESRLTIVETWINGGMVSGDIETDNWAGPDYFFGPEFFGTPAPRAHMTFGDVQWRQRGNDFTRAHHQHQEFRQYDDFRDAVGTPVRQWVPVDGLVATVKVDVPSRVLVTSSFWAWSNRGTGGTLEAVANPVAKFRVGRFNETSDLMTLVTATNKTLYASDGTIANGGSRMASRQFHMSYVFDASPAGLCHFGVFCGLQQSTTVQMRNTFVVARNLTVEVNPSS